MRPIDADAFREHILGGKPIGLTICQYSESDILEMIREQPTITSLPNEPLTLEELRKMDGEPVWVVEGKCAHYALITDVFEKALYLTCREDESEMLFDEYGKTWTAYAAARRETKMIKPLEQDFCVVDEDGRTDEKVVAKVNEIVAVLNAMMDEHKSEEDIK